MQNPTPISPKATPSRGPRTALIVIALAAGVAAAFGLYAFAHQGGKQVAHSGACAQSLDLARAVDPLVHGEVAALMLANEPRSLAGLSFDDADGHKTTLAAFKGKAVLLNLWATWCAPCRAEMPALDRLQAKLGGKDGAAFSVVPVNVDVTRIEKARSYFKDNDVKSLPYYADNSGDILQAIKQSVSFEGLPTTVLVGGDGCVIGTMAGPAQWDSQDAQALIDRVVKQSAAPKQPA